MRYQGRDYGHCRIRCETHEIPLGGCKCMGPHEIVDVPCPDTDYHRKRVAELEAKANEPVPEPTVTVELTKAEVIQLRIIQARYLREMGGALDPRIMLGAHLPVIQELHAEGVVVYDKLGVAQFGTP